MDIKRNTVSSALLLALGTSLLPATVSAIIPDGDYAMIINNTPYEAGYQFGSDGAWNSSFTFGCVPRTKGCGSQAMYDDTVASPVNGKYSGSANDGIAGFLNISVISGSLSVSSFSLDTIPATAGGSFQQYTDASIHPVTMTGSVDASGNMTLTPTGRLGTFSDFPSLVDKRWNVDNFNGLDGFIPAPPNNNTTYQSFSTDSAAIPAGTIHGTRVTNIGDVDGDAKADFSAVLVSGGLVGADWGGFFGAPYLEAWNVTFLSGTIIIPTFEISINVDGGLLQECTQTGGSYVTLATAIPLGLELESTTWTVDNIEAGAGATLNTFLGVGTHSVAVSAKSTDGQIGTDTVSVNIADTTAPDLQLAFVDARSGTEITRIERANVKWVSVDFSATDVCDPAPVLTGISGFPINDGDQLKIKGKKSEVTLTTSTLTLSVTAEDASGRRSEGQTTLLISP